MKMRMHDSTVRLHEVFVIISTIEIKQDYWRRFKICGMHKNSNQVSYLQYYAITLEESWRNL